MENKEKTNYDVLIITNMSYGLYSGFSTGIIGLSTYIFCIKNSNSLLYKIWKEESMGDYEVVLDKINIKYKYIEEVFYTRMGDTFITTGFIGDEVIKINSKNIILALSEDTNFIPKVNIDITNFEFKPNIYIIGEKAFYEGKEYYQDIFTGEANIVANIIYKKIHNIDKNISIHSTEIIK